MTQLYETIRLIWEWVERHLQPARCSFVRMKAGAEDNKSFAWSYEEQFDWIGATVKTTRFICVVRASRISLYYWREKMRFDCVFLSIISRLQVAHDHRSIFRDHRPIKTAVGGRICGRSMFTALRITNNNHVPAAQHWFQQLWRRLRLLHKLQPTDIIKVLQTARFSILQIIFVLGENFNFFISPEDSGVAASALWFI